MPRSISQNRLPIAGPKIIEVERNFGQPIRSLEPETKAPVLELQREAPSLINKLDTDVLNDGPGLGGVDLETEPGVTKPQYKFRVEPKYPESAKKAEKEGEVILQTTIDEKGIPQNIKALTNLGFGLEEAAIAALKKTTFSSCYEGWRGAPVCRLKYPTSSRLRTTNDRVCKSLSLHVICRSEEAGKTQSLPDF